MEPISKKIATRREIFELFDTKDIQRIDTMDLIAIIQLASLSKPEATLTYMMKIFGFVNKIFSRDEFHFYLDSLFAGIINTAIVSNEKTKSNIK